jgi:hypothetical protein
LIYHEAHEGHEGFFVWQQKRDVLQQEFYIKQQEIDVQQL